jgi:hypothetical protein
MAYKDPFSGPLKNTTLPKTASSQSPAASYAAGRLALLQSPTSTPTVKQSPLSSGVVKPASVSSPLTKTQPVSSAAAGPQIMPANPVDASMIETNPQSPMFGM